VYSPSIAVPEQLLSFLWGYYLWRGKCYSDTGVGYTAPERVSAGVGMGRRVAWGAGSWVCVGPGPGWAGEGMGWIVVGARNVDASCFHALARGAF
jgi:hypothetical protein